MFRVFWDAASADSFTAPPNMLQLRTTKMRAAEPPPPAAPVVAKDSGVPA